MYEINFRPLTTNDIAEISQIHHQELPNDFLSILGADFLQNHFYPSYFSTKLTFGYGAFMKDKLVGYVLFSNDRKALARVIKNSVLTLCSYCLKHIYKLSFLKYLIEVIIITLVKPSNDMENNNYELVYIAISKDFANNKIGSRLVSIGLNHLKTLEEKATWVKTLSNTQKNIEFYLKSGYQVYNEYLGRTYLACELTSDV
ncbi:MAG: GNAT family N-acetyltransferase [Bacteriovoracaceae bacterium]|jgi:ribosomal protein S18 acetylase RimI-like enzyme|nr:GNAT family N-acetyltransferase [Bacteriovoracaceae bacterium]